MPSPNNFRDLSKSLNHIKLFVGVLRKGVKKVRCSFYRHDPFHFICNFLTTCSSFKTPWCSYKSEDRQIQFDDISKIAPLIPLSKWSCGWIQCGSCSRHKRKRKTKLVHQWQSAQSPGKPDKFAAVSPLKPVRRTHELLACLMDPPGPDCFARYFQLSKLVHCFRLLDRTWFRCHPSLASTPPHCVFQREWTKLGPIKETGQNNFSRGKQGSMLERRNWLHGMKTNFTDSKSFLINIIRIAQGY